MLSIISLVMFALLQSQVGDEVRPKAREIVTSDVDAVVLAIQDEIYDYGYQDEFWAFETTGPQGPEAHFNIYIQPDLVPAPGGLECTAIYKYPPFGEVIRPFVLAPDGAAYLVGRPDNRFPWTQPSTKTIYMDDDEICRDKREWRRVLFELDLTPSANRVRQAVERQKMRVGYSQWESSRAHRN